MTLYLDHNATTPVAPSVLDAMRPYLTARFGNPSSAHAQGSSARRAVDAGRASVAEFLGAAPDEVIFTGSGSEANNLAIRGAVLASSAAGRDTVVTQATEHPSVLATAHATCRLHGLRVVVVGVDRYGVVDLDALSEVVDERTAIVSVQVANGETGTLQPVPQVAAIARRHGALTHADACQAAGKVPVDIGRLGVDLLGIAAHKMYGPKGIGALYRRAGVALEPLVHGGGQECGLRAGTPDVASIAGFAAACEVARRAVTDADRVRSLREGLLSAVTAGAAHDVHLNGHPARRLPNTLNISFAGADGAAVLAAAGELAASTGSACHAGRPEPSAVLTAMGCSLAHARGAIRLSLGRGTRADEVERAAGLLIRATAADRARAMTGDRS